MNTLFSESTLVYELREDGQDGDVIGHIHGRAVPYGEATKVGGVTETIERDAFDAAEAVGKPLAYRHGEPIGIITAILGAPVFLWILLRQAPFAEA